MISIHALCEEGDTILAIDTVKDGEISIHALCEEGDGSALSSYAFCKIFLSTPSARRATIDRTRLANIELDFYPRPLRGGRPSL